MEDHADNIMNMEINPEIKNNELIDGVAWISGMPAQILNPVMLFKLL